MEAIRGVIAGVILGVLLCVYLRAASTEQPRRMARTAVTLMVILMVILAHHFAFGILLGGWFRELFVFAPVFLLVYFILFVIFHNQLGGRGVWTYSISLAMAITVGWTGFIITAFDMKQLIPLPPVMLIVMLGIAKVIKGQIPDKTVSAYPNRDLRQP